jgi:hypothetical protein
MEFRIADSFTTSLARLTGDEQKTVKNSAFDLQVNPAHPGLQFHRIEKSKDKHFWSIRAGADIRIIVHKTENNFLLCYVDHHDKAYQWAERRRLEIHPRTGAAQFVEIRERIEEIVIPVYVESQQEKSKPKPVLAGIDKESLLQCGVPEEWIADLLLADEDTLLQLADHLPAEASEAVLVLATGGKPAIREKVPATTDPFQHPDSQRRFRVLQNVAELEAALSHPWEKWILFLHPSQKEIVEKLYSGPARVAGTAGTGKTIVALHRAVVLARRYPEARVLLTTFSKPLANALRARLVRMLGSEPRLAERLDVKDLDSLAAHLYGLNIGKNPTASSDWVTQALTEASASVSGHKFSLHFLRTEWDHVVDAWTVETWEAYRDVRRLGRKTRLTEAQRQLLWSIFEKVIQRLKEEGRVTVAQMFNRLASFLAAGGKPPYEYTIVDECQDIQVAQLRFLAAMGKGRSEGLFFAGDLGQRIFQTPFSWKSLGVDVRGRATTLKVNYRTSHQIRMRADQLLGIETTDVDGLIESRKGAVSVFNGPEPEIELYPDSQSEINAVAKWLQDLEQEGYKGHEIGVFVRSEAELERAITAVGSSGFSYRILNADLEILHGHVSIGTMHLAKGLEFRAVAVMACDDEILPLQSRMETASDESDLSENYETERHLLYVACTRARDRLHISCGGAASDFIADME